MMTPLRMLAAGAAVLSMTLLTGCGDSGPATPDAAQFGKQVRAYLLKNPEVIREALIALEKKEVDGRKKKRQQTIVDNAAEIFKSATSPVAGNPKGDVTVVEYFDYNCPYCRQAFRDLNKLMKADNNVKFVFKEYPIFGGASKVAAEAALAAKKQGKYLEFHEALLAGEKRLTEASVFKIAQKIGLDVDKLKKDMKADDVKKELAAVVKTAGALGIQGTPAFLVGSRMIPGAPRDLYDRLKQDVEAVRKAGCKVC